MGDANKLDERILGDGNFVEEGFWASQESMERRYHLRAQGIDLGHPLFPDILITFSQKRK